MLLSLLICNRLFIKNRVKDITTDSGTVSESDSESSDIDGEYEVFLSFHGEDTRKVFADFLYTFLRVARIHTFRDNEDLRVGETIGSEIVEAIKQSKISIPIFSKNYAFSKWCMLELVQMVESMESNGQKIFPIFYDVRPYDVRHQTGNYEKAFHQHKKNFDLKTVQQWKDALAKVGKMKGLELENETKGYQGKLAKKIVKKVLHKLKKSAVNLPEILIDMEHHKEKLKTLLNLNSNCVCVVGIHGMGGIGKTTIAKVIYNELRKSFTSCFFLENIQEKSHDPQNLIKLQNQLISVLAKGKFSDIVNTEEGRERTKDVVKGKKTLLVLDDVDENSQFDMLVSNSNIFAPGSRIIVTTRNKEVLNYLESTYEVYRSYEPSLMNFDQSLQLFSKFAFNSDFPPEDYITLSENIVSAVAGLPLAVESIAKSLRGNHDRESWNAKLQEMEKIPHPVVLGTLRRSFEALNDRERHVFLDIACLFIGEDRIISSYMWKDCELNPASAIHTNVLKSLIKVKDDDSLWMHEQLRDLGRQIVREENIDQAGNRSRLWHREEALDIFDRCMGTNKVLALCLDLIQEEHESRPNRLIREDFGKLQNLRFLRVGSTDFEGDFKHIFSSLSGFNGNR